MEFASPQNLASAPSSTSQLRRVLMTADAVGGVWPYALEIASGLAQEGVQTILAVMGPPPSPPQRLAAHRVPGLLLFERDFKLEWMEDPWADVERAGRWLLDLESRHQPDIIHLNGYAHGALPWRAPVLIVAHSCVYSWFTAVKSEEPPASWWRYRQEVILGLQGADWVAAPTRAMLDALNDHYGRQGSQSVIHNGRTLEITHAPTKDPLIFSAGRLWDEAKNIKTLDRAARQLDWPVYVAGDCRSPGGGEVALAHVHPLGPLSPAEMAHWFAKASIYALPAFYEPFGLSVLEAALAGCALVLGDIPTLRELWGDDALYVKPLDPAGLARVLERLMLDEPLRFKYARRASLRALHFTPERMTRQYRDLYLQLLVAKKNRGPDRAPASSPAWPIKA